MIARIAGILMIAAAVIGGYWTVWLSFLCNRTIRSVEQTTRAVMSHPAVVAAPIATANLAALQTVHVGCCSDPSYYMLRAMNQNILMRRDAAIRDLRRALTVDQRPEIYFDIGLILLETGRVDEAVDAITEAARFNPHLLDHLHGEVVTRVRARIGS